MIQSIQFKFGSSPSENHLSLNTTPVTVFVGPNNSGKSRILIEIETASRTAATTADNVILKSLTFSKLNNAGDEFENILKTHKPDIQDNLTFTKRGNQKFTIGKNTLLNILLNPFDDLHQFCVYYLDLKTIRIDGGTRIQLINDQPASDLQQPPINTFDILFRDSTKRKEVRRIIYDAFKKYFVIDPTKLGTFRLRLSELPPKDEIQECGVHAEAVKFHNQASLILQASDGIKAFTGIITSLVAGEPKVILIDEPEAFLHPSLSTILGKEVSNIVSGTEKSLFVSTHSSNFLMGCIHSGVPINIVRLTYLNGVPTARLLPSEKVLKLMRHPLLRSTGILNGLFYDCIIVTEADADRAFYQEINERVLKYDSKRGISNCLFINAQNKHTIHELMKPLREMGIPCAAIVDVDVIKEGGTQLSNLLNGAYIPEVTRQSMAASRGFIKNKFDEKNVDFKVLGGVEVLDSADKESCNNLFDQLDMYGIFPVRKGELESWLKSLNIQATHSPNWLIEVFEKLGEDPTANSYVKPAKGDVWDFIGNIKTWFEDPNRKGIPN